MERLKELLREWYTSIDDLVADIVDAGFVTEDVSRECVTAWDEKTDNDRMVVIYLGGTERTITVDSITEV